ncbi:cytochrome P450 [Xylaria bambusicola]|uniref:cytochrome P450 n=1 Tax=Xylaria bambusicola TaxID=326684 RepID=UPI002008DD82|nr:cytochrome P450 [Xylaria bambusicola]KAI0506888.1 cytochrome P450 [Xylaria bambusicola]
MHSYVVWSGDLPVWASLALLLTIASLVSILVNIVYNLLYHPLAHLPGPKLAAISNVPYSYWFLGGRQPFKIHDLHLKYGPVVRVAPNEVSFNTAGSWKDIYASRGTQKTFIKSEFYDGGSFAGRGVHSIVSERQPQVHAEMRHYLSSAFSDRALNEQEDLISQSVDKFVELLPKQSDDWDLTKGYEMLTFDIIGDLAFGESFGAIESAEPHPWIAIILGALKQGALVDVFKRFPTAGIILTVLLHYQIKKLTADTGSNEEMAIDLVERRIARESSRKDFLTRLLEDRVEKGVSVLQLAAHTSDFVIAGSETTATALATMTYYLLRNPEIMMKLQEEIRSSFTSYNEITGKSTQRLKYLKAVMLEAMRIYPPLPFALPRVVPSPGELVDGTFLPGGTIVYTSPYSASMDPANFETPTQFIPERWLGGNTQDILDATQPFSLGSRGCMGKSLGLLELRLIMSKIIWKYDLELLDKSIDWHADSQMQTLWQKPKMRVKARDRLTSTA